MRIGNGLDYCLSYQVFIRTRRSSSMCNVRSTLQPCSESLKKMLVRGGRVENFSRCPTILCQFFPGPWFAGRFLLTLGCSRYGPYVRGCSVPLQHPAVQ